MNVFIQVRKMCVLIASAGSFLPIRICTRFRSYYWNSWEIKYFPYDSGYITQPVTAISFYHCYLSVLRNQYLFTQIVWCVFSIFQLTTHTIWTCVQFTDDRVTRFIRFRGVRECLSDNFRLRKSVTANMLLMYKKRRRLIAAMMIGSNGGGGTSGAIGTSSAVACLHNGGCLAKMPHTSSTSSMMTVGAFCLKHVNCNGSASEKVNTHAECAYINVGDCSISRSVVELRNAMPCYYNYRMYLPISCTFPHREEKTNTISW